MDENLSDLPTVGAAIALIDALPVVPRKIELPLNQAVGLRLAQDLSADRDYPPFDKALMDGYAVRSADVSAPPVDLVVIGESAAGRAAAGGIGPMQAMAVMTGAALAHGADAVVPIEQTASTHFATAGQSVRILHAASAGRAVALRGSDTRQGSIVLAAGMVLQAARVAVAATIGARQVSVWDRPDCAVLATGDELIALDQPIGADQLRNSNGPMLTALLGRLGCRAVDLGIAVDDPAAIAAAIREGLHHDVLFVAGGMSMGQYDYVPRILADLGGELKITKLRIKPGKPFVLAVMPGGKYVFGLPGNPLSAYVCTVRLAARLLARMAGGRAEDRIVRLPLAEPVAANGPREFYQPAQIDGGCVRPLAWKGSADIFTLAKADALLVRAENAAAAGAGEKVSILRLD